MGAKQQLLFDIFEKKEKLDTNHEFTLGGAKICEEWALLDN
jgi:hypothetical protein